MLPVTTLPLITLDRATVYRGDRAVLRNFSLAIRVGEHTAILGPNGAGKSTLIKLLACELPPYYRTGPPARYLFGQETWNLFELRRHLGIVSFDLQEAYDETNTTLFDVIASGCTGSIGVNERLTKDQRFRVRELLHDFAITHLANRTAATVSTGELRRALLARALVHRPAVLLLDEPTTGLDPAAARQFRQTIARLHRQTTLIIVTHHVEDIVTPIDRIVFMRDGRVLADDTKERLLTTRGMRQIFGVSLPIKRTRDGRYFLTA